MRSRGDRAPLERALRVAAFGLLAACAIMQGARPHRRTDARQERVAGALARWTREPLDTLAVALESAPPPLERDWLGALREAGTEVAWSGDVAAAAIETQPVADPAGGDEIFAAAPSGSWVTLADSLGAVDSARVRQGGAAFRLAAHAGPLRAAAARQLLHAGATDSAPARRAVVLGRAGWEARFVILALEERGWTVDARLAIGPNVFVTQGRPLPLDTAVQSVVVAVDSLTAADAAALARFVSNGGGLVLLPAAAAAAPPFAAGRVGEHVRAPTVAFTAAAPRSALGLDPVLPRADAIALVRERGHVVLAARRVGAGRVVQTGFAESWRWRMGGVDDAADAHRAWWADIVAAAAYRPAIGRWLLAGGDDRAPLASLVNALGPARTLPAARAATRRDLLVPAAILLFAVLLAEWTSRRLRGAA